MHAVNLIARAIRDNSECPVLPASATNGICCVTGDSGSCVNREEIFGKSFTNLDILKAPESPLISTDAYLALGYKWERMSLWICDGNQFIRPDRKQVREYVLHGMPLDAWAAYVTTSYKKHGALWAKINNGPYGVWRFEMRDVDCRDVKKINAMYDRLNTALYSGIGRSILESLDCSAFIVGKIGINKWLEFEQWARPIYQSSLYQFMCYFLPSKEELKNV